jgi:hypothetical protein
MAGRDWDASGEAAAALRTVLEDYGAACLSNAQQMSSVLRDLLPNRPREASVLVAAVEADVASVLRDRVQVGVSPPAAAQQAAAVLEDRTGLAAAACQWAVAAFADALGYPVDVAELSTEASSGAPVPAAGLVPPQPTGTRADVPPAAPQFGGQAVGGALAGPAGVAAAAAGPPHLQGVAPDAYLVRPGAPAAGPAPASDPQHLLDPPGMQAIAPDAYLVRPAQGASGQPADPAAAAARPPGAAAGWAGSMAPPAGQPAGGVAAPQVPSAGQPGTAPPGAIPPGAVQQGAGPPGAIQQGAAQQGAGPPGAIQQGAVAPGAAAQPTAPGAAWPGATAQGAGFPPGGAGYQPTAAAQVYPQGPPAPSPTVAGQPSLYPAVAVPTPDQAVLEVRRKFFVAARFAFAAAALIAAYDFVAPYALGAPFAIAFSLLGLSLAGSAVYASRRASAVFGGGAVLGASVATIAFLGNIESVFWSNAFFHQPGRPTESTLVLLGALVLAVVAAIYAARGLELGPRKPIGFAGVLAAGAALFALANIPAQASNYVGIGDWQAVIHIFGHGEKGLETLASVAYLVLITLPLALAAFRVMSPAGRAGIWAGWIVAALAWPTWSALDVAAAPSRYGITATGLPVRADTGLYLALTCWVLMLVLGAVGLLRKEPARQPAPQAVPPAGV